MTTHPRTSLTQPLQIAELPTGAGGAVGVTFCPGKCAPSLFGPSWQRDLAIDLDAIKAWGAECVVTLVEHHELESLQVARLGDEVRARGMRWLHLPIVDVNVPSAAFEAEWKTVVHDLVGALGRGGKVLVHCKGGWGGPARFEAITGFDEQGYAQTQRRLDVVDGKLVSDASPKRYGVGMLETPSLRELRERTAGLAVTGQTRVSIVQGDVRKMHSVPQNEGALFQVASQFNLLEMVSPSVSPDDGVTRYQGDPTQGPACAIAAGAATIYRNDLHVLPDGSRGQTAQRQVDCIADLGQALGNEDGSLWTMRNGYTMLSAEGLRTVDERLAAASEVELDELRSLLRIGLHSGVDVTDLEPGHAVSQAFCSALPVSYNRIAVPHERWRRFSVLVLEAA